MRKLLTAGVAALTMAASLGAVTAPAVAAPFHHHGGRGVAWGVGAGLAGLAIGAALASDRPYYDYGPGYYDPYYDGCAHRVWDPYWGRWVIRNYC